MKKNIISLFAFAMLCLSATTGMAVNANTLYGKDIAAVKGATSQVVNLYMGNQTPICGLQFDMYLPDGITMKSITLGAERFEDLTYTLASEKQADGAIRVFCATSILTDAIWDDDIDGKDIRQTAPVFNVTLDIAEGCCVGAYDVEIGNITFSHYDEATRKATKLLGDNSASMLMIKPASGVEGNESENILSIATGTGENVDKDTYNGIVEGKDDVEVVDLRAATIGGDITSADDLKTDGMSDNVLFFLPEESEVTGNNVIVNGSCDKFAITDGANIKCPRGFNALVATYKRNFKNHAWQPLYLPFAVVADVLTGDFEIAKFSNSQDNEKEINVENVTSGTLEANSPYLIRLKDERALGEYDIPGESDVEKTLDKEMMVGPYYKLKTTYKKISGTDLQGKYALVGGVFKKAGNAASLGAFRIYLEAVSSSAKDEVTLSFDEPTGIRSAVQSHENTAERYNLNGMRVDSNYKGIVIANGRKEIWR